MPSYPSTQSPEPFNPVPPCPAFLFLCLAHSHHSIPPPSSQELEQLAEGEATGPALGRADEAFDAATRFGVETDASDGTVAPRASPMTWTLVLVASGLLLVAGLWLFLYEPRQMNDGAADLLNDLIERDGGAWISCIVDDAAERDSSQS